MSIHLYDTGARQIRDFSPLIPGRVSIYLCGATVQAAPHIGHIRSGLNFDIMRRWFAYRGYDVTFVRNVTDIDDKILAKAADQGCPWWAIGYANERAFNDGYAALGCLPPTVEPRATGHVTEMVEMMRGLIERGHAYAADGNVYFDVRSFPGYLELSNQDLDHLLQPSGEGETGKRDPRDFAMWKAAKKEGEPSWETPWGRGRPGWHLECSAMAHKYLGDAFDIHGGGLDLIFPHHENEIAQAKAFGDDFAAYWLHNAWVTISGEKMAKSLGNSVLVSEMVKQWRPIVLRYYLGTPHYRSMIEYSPEALHEAEAAFARIEGFMQRVVELAGPVEPATEVPSAFAEAMDDDFGVPQALAIVHTTVRQGNSALTTGDKETAVARLAEVRAMLGVLGLDPLDEHWAGTGTRRGDDLHGVVDSLVRLVLEQREGARGRKDYAAADAIRDRLQQSGLAIEDTPSGPRWTPHSN
ncbi:cysteine--tRNA ligase [Streptomyces sp. NPDC037389]|uniref:cysteine--tRNA ligase n=1 Tax=Streptomyces sp. NPDC037389 TaxID=3155369 RepID=UPI0033DF7927